MTCKRTLSPERLNTVTDEAVEWLSAQAHGDPTAFSDELLRDKSLHSSSARSSVRSVERDTTSSSDIYIDKITP